MKIYIALDVTRTEGMTLSAEEVREEFENEIPETLDVDMSSYDVKVIGIGGTEAELKESIKVRKGHR